MAYKSPSSSFTFFLGVGALCYETDSLIDSKPLEGRNLLPSVFPELICFAIHYSCLLNKQVATHILMITMKLKHIAKHTLPYHPAIAHQGLKKRKGSVPTEDVYAKIYISFIPNGQKIGTTQIYMYQ